MSIKGQLKALLQAILNPDLRLTEQPPSQILPDVTMTKGKRDLQ